ncbi:MAG: rod shape-determining protein RodA [Deltaproteobacteria bacterium CG11_big_fil_rev_8_21_14_0_20_47_16]|nr:MAG: rod shape-determining protein RodA [Deltaproteobacteria bacterium CG11_big_fil_rev_8_21_14_0_20_47_16]
MKKIAAAFVICCAVAVSPLTFAVQKAPVGAKAYIISPKNGETVTNPVTVLFGLSGMGVAPAGVVHDNTGHFHLLIDVKKSPKVGTIIPADKNHIHYGGGQTQATIDLSPGEHTLQLVMGDQGHMTFSPSVQSEKITITVK